MDMNIKAKNMSFVINGNKKYENHLGDDWRLIQKSLNKSDLAILLCNAKASDEHVFAFVINEDCKYPILEYCGHSYWAASDILGFKHLLTRSGVKEYENIYYSPIEEMAFVNTGQHKSLHRVHTLSELLLPTIKTPSSPKICSFANINYTLGDSTIYTSLNINKGAERLTEKLLGAKMELEYIRSVISPNNLRVFDLDNATKFAFFSLSNYSIDILHISSHAYFDSIKCKIDMKSNLASSIDGSAIMDNCCIKLSGYNDNKLDGLITANEISRTNLSSIPIVILDACETGTGDLIGSDVYSLAEAFHTAGVRYVIATTSKVEDDDACNFFVKFLDNVIAGNSYHDSFHTALSVSRSPEKYILWE
jgi:hypothetical protein